MVDDHGNFLAALEECLRQFRPDISDFTAAACQMLNAVNPLSDDVESLGFRELPDRRSGFTQKAVIGGHTVYIRTGEYEDETLGEVIIDVGQTGTPLRNSYHSVSHAISIGLQHGTPLDAFVNQYVNTRGEPSGAVEGDEHIKYATSILDYVMRVLAVHYLERDDLAHVAVSTVPDAPPPEDQPSKPPRPNSNKGPRLTLVGKEGPDQK